MRRKPSCQSTVVPPTSSRISVASVGISAQRLQALLEDRFLADQRPDVGAPLLEADGLFTAPVDGRRRHRSLFEQLRDHRDDVVFMDRVVHGRAARRDRDRNAAKHHLHVKERPSPVVAVRHIEARDDGGHVEGARHRPDDDLPRDLGDGIRWEHWLVVVAEGGALGPGFVVGRIVDRSRRAVQERLRGAAVRHQQAGRFGVGAEVLVPSAALGHRQVEHVVEVGRKSAEVTRREVDGLAPNARLLQAFPCRRVAEAGDAPHFVVGREGLRDGCGDLAARSGDQDFGSAHALIVGNGLKRAGGTPASSCFW